MDDVVKSFIDFIFGKGFITAATDAVVVDLSTDSVSLINNISESVAQPIGAVLLTIYLVLELMEKLTTDNFSAEQFVKLLIKFAFGQIIITNITGWSFMFMNAGVSFMMQIVDASGGISQATVDMGGIDNSLGGIIKGIALIAQLIIPFLISAVLRVAIYFMGFGRALEMILRSMMAPIGCADVITGGTNSSGIRYMKRMLGISLQGGIMIAIIAASALFINELLVGEGVFTIGNTVFLMKYLGVVAAMVGILGQSKSIAFEIVGA